MQLLCGSLCFASSNLGVMPQLATAAGGGGGGAAAAAAAVTLFLSFDIDMSTYYADLLCSSLHATCLAHSNSYLLPPPFCFSYPFRFIFTPSSIGMALQYGTALQYGVALQYGAGAGAGTVGLES